MPSPIAHCSMTALLMPLHRRGCLPDALVRHRHALTALVFFACAMPDLDFLIGALAPGSAPGTHGMGTHSLFSVTIAAILLAMIWQLLFKAGLGWLFLLVLMAGYSHLLLDMMTGRSRGIALLWPFVDERMRLPWNLFYGVHHDKPLAWRLHLITVSTELVFLAVMVLLGSWFSRRREPIARLQSGVKP